MATRVEAEVASAALGRCPLAPPAYKKTGEDALFEDEVVGEGSGIQGSTTAVP